jgi:ADP-ribose pyrophosphatase
MQMKLAHLSDLHLGKRLNEMSLMEDQRHILLEILGIIEKEKPDGVIIYAVTSDREKVLLVRQYRYPIDNYVYELPAGLVDPGEDYRTAAVREVHEETGLHFTPIEVDPMFEKPRYTTVGMTDECCAIVYGYIDGELSTDYLEATEEIVPLLADRAEVRRILKEERVAMPCADHIERFAVEAEPFAYMEKKN